MSPRIQHPTTTTPAAAGGGVQRWNSPIPYMFSGLALLLGAIALALVILACSYCRNSSSSSSASSNIDKSEKNTEALQAEAEPRIVVIMAGQTNPTFLANPVAAVKRVEQVWPTFIYFFCINKILFSIKV